MHATIRQYQVTPGRMDDVVRAIEREFVPRLRKIPGFAGYDVIAAGDRLATVSTFDSEDGTAASAELATRFLMEHPEVASAVSGRVTTDGELRLHVATDRTLGAAYRP